MPRLKSVFLSVVFALIISVVSPGQSQAQMACGELYTMLAKLESKYGEISRGAGWAVPSIFAVYANAETGSWTILKIMPNAETGGVIGCIMAVGNGWRDDDWQHHQHQGPHEDDWQTPQEWSVKLDPSPDPNNLLKAKLIVLNMI